jgi:NAD(P)H-dependent FMN reductase
LELQLPAFHERLSFLENPKKELVDVQQRLEDSGAFIFVTPEYNGGILSELKNFIDVFAKKPFDGKPIGVATGSTGIWAV